VTIEKTKNIRMKTNLKPFLLSSFFLLAFVPAKHHLPGKWTVYNSDGTSAGEYVELKNDGTYNVYLPGGQIGETGFYKFKHHIFSIRNIKDYVCGTGIGEDIDWIFMEKIQFISHLLKIHAAQEEWTLLVIIRA
jgi:hypothetical protein